MEHHWKAPGEWALSKAVSDTRRKLFFIDAHSKYIALGFQKHFVMFKLGMFIEYLGGLLATDRSFVLKAEI